jgi:hypothetical protein
MSTRCWELVATNEPTIVTKSLLGAVVVENSQCDGSLPDPACTNESNWCEILSEANNLLDEFVASKEDPWWRWRGFSRYTRCKYKMLDPLVVEIADLV